MFDSRIHGSPCIKKGLDYGLRFPYRSVTKSENCVKCQGAGPINNTFSRNYKSSLENPDLFANKHVQTCTVVQEYGKRSNK